MKTTRFSDDVAVVAAIDRIKSGRPKNEKLAALARIGKLKLNNSNAALEASQDLSTRHTRKYRDLKLLIAGKKSKSARPT